MPTAGAPDSGADAGVPMGGSSILSLDAKPNDVAPPSAEAGTPAARDACPDDPALLLCLRFEGSTVDESAPAATIVAERVGYQAGPTGMAARVGGASRVNANAIGAIGASFTIEAAVRLDRLPTLLGRVGVLDKQSHFGLFVLPGGDVLCSGFGMATTAARAIQVATWTTVGCTIGDGMVTSWVGGRRKTSAAASGTVPGGGANVAIGRNDPDGDALDGLIDNVRVWRGVRSAEQLCQSALGCP